MQLMFEYIKASFTYCITNTVSCRPMTIFEFKDVNGNPIDAFDSEEAMQVLNQPGVSFTAVDYNREPTSKEIAACRPHIDELVQTFNPRGIVRVGAVARSYSSTRPTIDILHPAAILREEYKLLPIKRQARKIETFIKSLTK